MLSQKILQKFLEKETGTLKKDKYSFKNIKRRYLHFDRRISISKIKDLLYDYLRYPENIEVKAFFPFIHTLISTPRYKKGVDGKRKIENKEREIYFSSHFDSLVFSLYATILSEKYETYISNKPFSESIIAYRSLNKSNIDFAKEVFDYIKLKGNCVALAFDVSKFFDNLNHQKLLDKWQMILGVNRLPKDHYNVFKNITKFSWVEQEEIFKELKLENLKDRKLKERICEPHEFRQIIRGKGLIKTQSHLYGIPQGSPISAILSNIYMLSFDKKLYEKVKKIDGFYRRYSDDIIVVCTKEHYLELKNFVLDSIKNSCSLLINTDKTDITMFVKNGEALSGFDEGMKNKKLLQYLGFEFNGEKVFIRSSSMSRYYRKMKSSVNETIKRAYGKNSIGDKIFRKKLYEKYTIRGGQNFISYGMRAKRNFGESESIRKQLSRHFPNIVEEIKRKALKKEAELIKNNKFKKSML